MHRHTTLPAIRYVHIIAIAPRNSMTRVGEGATHDTAGAYDRLYRLSRHARGCDYTCVGACVSAYVCARAFLHTLDFSFMPRDQTHIGISAYTNVRRTAREPRSRAAVFRCICTLGLFTYSRERTALNHYDKAR